MTTVLQSHNGPQEVINARRTESLDAPHILKLVNSTTEAQFGLVNVVNIIEKAVLAVTLNSEKEDVLSHAAFFDYPNIPSVDQSKWEEWITSNYQTDQSTPLNSLYLHYFVAKKAFSNGSAKEIIRTVFNAVPDIHYLYLVLPNGTEPEPALDKIFTPLDSKNEVEHTVYVCHRHEHSPVLFVRKARVEDHDDLTPIFNRQSDMLTTTYGSFFLAELIESQDDRNHCIIVEMDGSAVGFMSLSDDVDLELLNSCFELNPFHGLHKPHPDDVLTPPTPPPEKENADENAKKISRPNSQSSAGGDAVATAEDSASQSGQTDQPGGSAEPAVEIQRKLSEAHMHRSASVDGEGLGEAEDTLSVVSGLSGHGSTASRKGEHQELISPPVSLMPPFQPEYKGDLNAFSIQLFCIDERFEMRSMDFLAKAFSLYPDRDYCILTLPHLVPEFPLLQSFVRVTPKCPSTLPQELYLFSKSGLLESFKVRPVCAADKEAILTVVDNIQSKEVLVKDLETYIKARRDQDGTPIQAFAATCLGQVVGVAITRQEEDIEHVRSHYNIEDFIYFNHHRRDEHGHLHHFVLNPVFQHWSKHFLKEVLRQAHYTCLYYPVYPAYSDRVMSLSEFNA